MKGTWRKSSNGNHGVTRKGRQIIPEQICDKDENSEKKYFNKSLKMEK